MNVLASVERLSTPGPPLTGVAAPLGVAAEDPARVSGFEPPSSPSPGTVPLPLGDVAWNASATAFFLALLAARPATAAAIEPEGASLLRFHIAPHPRLWTAPGSIR